MELFIQFQNLMIEEKLSFCLLALFLISYSIYIVSKWNKVPVYEYHETNLDILKYAASILVILFHINMYVRVFGNGEFLVLNIAARLAVPLFFLIAGYLIAINETHGEHYIRKYLKNLFCTYVIWAIIYLPAGFQYLLSIDLPWYLFPFAIIFGFLYFGTYYHLWFFPALFLSVLILKYWKKYFSMNALLIISFVLLILGSLESYMDYLSPTFQSFFHQYYFSIFYTTRNFLFFGLFYVVLGYWIQKCCFRWGKKQELYLLASGCLFILDSMFVRVNAGIDANILLSAPFFASLLFLKVLYSKEWFEERKKQKIRQLSKYYFLVHPYVICFVLLLKLHQNVTVFVCLVLILTHVLSLLCIKLQKKYVYL